MVASREAPGRQQIAGGRTGHAALGKEIGIAGHCQSMAIPSGFGENSCRLQLLSSPVENASELELRPGAAVLIIGFPTGGKCHPDADVLRRNGGESPVAFEIEFATGLAVALLGGGEIACTRRGGAVATRGKTTAAAIR